MGCGVDDVDGSIGWSQRQSWLAPISTFIVQALLHDGHFVPRETSAFFRKMPGTWTKQISPLGRNDRLDGINLMLRWVLVTFLMDTALALARRDLTA
jgi:hypothetical protein